MKPGRDSVFREVGLLDDDCELPAIGNTDDPLAVGKPPRDGRTDEEMVGWRQDARPNSPESEAKVEPIARNHHGRLRRLLARTIFITALSIYLANTYLGFNW